MMTAKDSETVDDIFAEANDSPPKAKKVKKSDKPVKKADKAEKPKKAKPAPEESTGTVGRAEGEARGVKGINLFGLLREAFSSAKGTTVPEAIAAVRAGTEGTKAAAGGKYPEALIINRIKKFLAGAKTAKQLESLGENKAGETRYRYTGPASVPRGRARVTKTEKTEGKKAKKAKKEEVAS